MNVKCIVNGLKCCMSQTIYAVVHHSICLRFAELTRTFQKVQTLEDKIELLSSA